jgi:hypothetical protein
VRESTSFTPGKGTADFADERRVVGIGIAIGIGIVSLLSLAGRHPATNGICPTSRTLFLFPFDTDTDPDSDPDPDDSCQW